MIDQELRIENGRRWTYEDIAVLESVATEADCLGGADTDRDSGDCCA
jgi:hypothetical protein